LLEAKNQMSQTMTAQRGGSYQPDQVSRSVELQGTQRAEWCLLVDHFG
jgi:hypothetical protein